MKSLKDQLSRQKKKRETLMKDIQKLKQQTGIINNDNLSLDYKNRQNEIELMQDSIL